MTLKWVAKDPEEVVDYEHDWTLLLGETDTVDGPPECVADCDVVVDDTYMDATGKKQIVWLSGGTPGRCKLTLAINTTEGRRWEEGVFLPVRER